jgi:predicted small integral membrane protein
MSPRRSPKAFEAPPMGRAHRRAWVGVVAAAALFAVACSLGLWLIVLALCGAAAVLARHRVLARRGLPARLAAWAAHAPCGPSPPRALEHALAVDLAAVSRGYLDCLDRAGAVLADRVDDRWRCALGTERLARAQRLVADGALVGISPRREPRGGRLRCSVAAGATIVLLALGNLSQSRWWLLPLAVTYALLATGCAALYERRRALPEVLASRAVSDPIDGVFVMPEPDVVRSLVVLADNDRVVVQRARCLLERAGQHPHACRRLVHAERLLARRAGPPPSELPRRLP